MNLELIFSTSFKKSAKKLMKNRDFQMELQKTLSLLSENPFNPKLKTNKLKGILEGLYACRINYDFRIIFNLIVEVNKTSILLVDIGTHDEVY